MAEPGSDKLQPVLVPTRILDRQHERVPRGKSVWVACWQEALESLLRKGSYKRLMPHLQASPNMSDRVHSQLARNIAYQAMAIDRTSPVTVQRGSQLNELDMDNARLVIDLGEHEAHRPFQSTVDGSTTPLFHLKHFMNSATVPVVGQSPLQMLKTALETLSSDVGTSTGDIFALKADDGAVRHLVQLTWALHRARWWTGQGWN